MCVNKGACRWRQPERGKLAGSFPPEGRIFLTVVDYASFDTRREGRITLVGHALL